MKTPIPPARTFPRDRTRGSILIVAMIVSAIIAISLGSYIALTLSSLKMANRSFYNTAALNLAETGVEEALWCFNQWTGGASLDDAWDNWHKDNGSNTAWRKFEDFTLSGNVDVAVRVHVDNYNPPGSLQPVVVSKATITLPNETQTITKWLELTLRRRSRFAMGLVARNQITFRGQNAKVDSWNSLYDDTGALRASPVAYDPDHSIAHASGSVGSTSVAVGSVAINNADIWGYASVGGSSSSGISVGNGGTISDFTHAAGYVDTSRVATDFTANFDNVTAPANAGTTITTMPATLGTAGVTQTFTYIGTKISSSFTIAGNVTLIITMASGEAVAMTGNDLLTIAAGSSLKLYASASLKFMGNGISNLTGQATALQIYSTATSTGQSIDIGGNAFFKGLVYAPNSDVTLNGDPDVMGSIVANNITVVGNAKFHYDESLANFGGNNPFGVVKWRELISETDRSPYYGRINSW